MEPISLKKESAVPPEYSGSGGGLYLRAVTDYQREEEFSLLYEVMSPDGLGPSYFGVVGF